MGQKLEDHFKGLDIKEATDRIDRTLPEAALFLSGLVPRGTKEDIPPFRSQLEPVRR